MTDNATQKLLKKYSREEYRVLIKEVKAERLGKETEANDPKLKSRLE